MAQKSVITRIQNKHDIPANWEKATFIPLAGELIIYDDHYFDEEGNKVVVADSVRYKIGDGVTQINELPFVADFEGRLTELEALNVENGTGASSIQQTGSDCLTTGEFAVSLGFGGKYAGNPSARDETVRVLKALSNAGEPVYCEYGTIKYTVVIKEDAASCVNKYDAYFGAVSGNFGCYVLTDVENRKFSSFSIANCYSYAGVNKGKASVITGTKQYNDAKYTLVAGTQNVVGDNQENTYNDNVYGSFNIVRGTKNSIIGGKLNTSLSGQYNQIGGYSNTANNAVAATVGGSNNSVKDFYNSIAIGTYLDGGGEGKAIFGNTNINNPNATLIVGNGDANGRSNAFEVLKDGSAKVGRQTDDTDDSLVLATKGFVESKINEPSSSIDSDFFKLLY